LVNLLNYGKSWERLPASGRTFVILSGAFAAHGLSASSNAPAMGGKQAASRDTDARSRSAAVVSARAGRLAARDEMQQPTANVDGLPHP
jgi:hypothetical protein